MRVSIDEEDPAYVSPQQRRSIRIRVDGKEVSRVRMADEKEGVVLKDAYNEETGRYITDGVVVLSETLHGVVEIDMPEDLRATLSLRQAGGE